MRRSEAGAVLIFALLVMGVLIGIVALVVDIGILLYVKQEAVKAAELSARRGVSEMYVPDYQPMTLPAGDGNPVPGLDDDKWWSQFLEAPARSSVRSLAARHDAGWTMAFAPYAPDVQINDANSVVGDILLGNWNKAPGGAFSFAPSSATINTNAGLARATQVTVRRIQGPEIPGVSEGGNPIPVHFAQILGVNQMQVRTTVTTKLDPAAMLGPGALVPMFSGQTAVTGTMPLAFRHNAIVRRIRPGPAADITVRDWVVGNNPAVMVRVRVTPGGTNGNPPITYAGSAYWVSFPSAAGGTAFDRLMRRLVFLAQKPAPLADPREAPPLCQLGLPLNGPGQGDGIALNPGQSNNIFQTVFRAGPNSLTGRTWTVPLVVNGGANNRQTAGFLRVYCEASTRNVGNNPYEEFDLRLAPSACSRNSGPSISLTRLTPAAVPPASVLAVYNDVLWLTDPVDGLRSGPRAFGVSCATVSADY